MLGGKFPRSLVNSTPFARQTASLIALDDSAVDILPGAEICNDVKEILSGFNFFPSSSSTPFC